jgi:hypothetical protein
VRNFLLALLSLLTLHATLAQQRVVFEGYVSEEKTSERIPDVVIVNSRSEERIMTDRSGRFRIEARANDTLVFSRPGYGYRYQAARNADSVRVTLPLRDIDLKDPDRPSGSAIKIPQAKAPTLANPIDFLYDQLGNRPRQMRELTLLLTSDQYRNQLAESRNRTALFELTGLTEARIEEVLLFCRYNQSSIRSATDFELLVSLIQCHQEFEERQSSPLP